MKLFKFFILSIKRPALCVSGSELLIECLVNKSCECNTTSHDDLLTAVENERYVFSKECSASRLN